MRGLLTHLRSVHFLCELRGVTLKCGQGDCVRCYSTFNSLAHHLRAHHSDPSLSASDDVDPGSECIGMGASGNEITDRVDAPPQSGLVMCNKTSATAAFVASLMSSTSVTQKTVQSVIEHTSALVTDIVMDIAGDVKNTLTRANILNNPECESLVSRLQQFSSPLDLLNTQHKRVQCFKSRYGMVEAKSVFLGNRYDQCLDPATGSMRQVIKRDTFQYVPILQLIALLLSDDSIFRESVKDRVSADGVMRDFCDGSL